MLAVVLGSRLIFAVMKYDSVFSVCFHTLLKGFPYFKNLQIFLFILIHHMYVFYKLKPLVFAKVLSICVNCGFKLMKRKKVGFVGL